MGRAIVPGGLRGDMIDVRWNDRVNADYKGGMYRMDQMMPRLYWRNLFLSSHFKDGNPSSLPSWAIARMETWNNGLLYVRFVRDPQPDPEFHEALLPYFN